MNVLKRIWERLVGNVSASDRESKRDHGVAQYKSQLMNGAVTSRWHCCSPVRDGRMVVALRMDSGETHRFDIPVQDARMLSESIRDFLDPTWEVPL